jgi:RNA polymerase sigma factor (TIGR02999 family)
MDEPGDVTELLVNARDGNNQGADRLLPYVYDKLRAVAERLMREERLDHTLQATALVHEAYLRLVDQSRVQWRDRAHFFAVAAQALRRILVDHARTHGREKRGGGRASVLLQDELAASYQEQVDIIALDEALEALAAKHPDHARIVEMRFFAGLTIDEVAAVLGVTARTVERRWRFARAWLRQALSEDGDERSSETSHGA